jgi:membrane protein YqaA with SNARE-associated domain
VIVDRTDPGGRDVKRLSNGARFGANVTPPALPEALVGFMGSYGVEMLVGVASQDLLGAVLDGITPLFGDVIHWWESKSRAVIEAATGSLGLAIIFAYSFLIAFALPGPSEVVLIAPLQLDVPYWLKIMLIMTTSAVGKAAGSVFAFHIGQEAKQAGPIVRWLRRSRFDVVEWSEKRTVKLAQKYGYAGLAMALCVPFFPDTLSIYAFAVLEEDYAKFAAATFVGSIGRLVVTIGLVGLGLLGSEYVPV